MGCDMCGKDVELVNVNIEGTILNVCSGCSQFGDIVEEVEVVKPMKVMKNIEEAFSEDFVEGFEKVVRDGREKKGLTQKEVASKLSIKESVIHKIENGFAPDLVLARKLENFFSVKLIRIYENKLDFKNKNLKIKDLL